MKTKRFTILHANDMHGDFLAEMRGESGKLIGGLSLLSGYVRRVRAEESNTIFCIAGDMVQGSIIDSEYQGISTIELMNCLSPDVATLGNHEFDYGLPHMLFLEKMANFPIVNANLYIRNRGKRLMKPYHIMNMDGFTILFIGIITEDVIDSLRNHRGDLTAFVSLEEACAEVGKICNAYRTDDIDLTVLLTHIGFEADKDLAAMLDPQWGVDMIIGGHSHTLMAEPARVNNILIAQAGAGTDQIGRFDIVVDDDSNSIVEWSWQLVPITSDTAEPDPQLEQYIDTYKAVVDHKYSSILCNFAHEVPHPRRGEETPLGNLLADGLAAMTGLDVVLLGSGSIRQPALGPLVTLGDVRACFPYDDALHRVTVSGATLKQMFGHFMRPSNQTNHGEYYQVNGAVRAVYSRAEGRLASLTVRGEPVDDDRRYTVCLQGYHCGIAEKTLGTGLGPSKVVSTAAREVLEEYLREHQNLRARVEGRLTYTA